MEYIWAFTTVVGPILLGLAILYASFRYLRRDRRDDRASELSARRVREELAREEDRPAPRG